VRQYGHLDAEGLLKVLIGEVFPGRIAVTTSFGTEAAVSAKAASASASMATGSSMSSVTGASSFGFSSGSALMIPAVVFAIGKKKVAGSAHEGPMRLKGLTTADIGRFYTGFERL